jgi:hypothetical protein
MRQRRFGGTLTGLRRAAGYYDFALARYLAR